MESWECCGYWWRPDNVDEVFLGNLKYVPGEGAILTLSDFSDRVDIFKSVFDTSTYYDIILGVLSDGKKVTVYQNYVVHSTGHHSWAGRDNVYLLSLKSRYVFVGHHFEERDKIQFKLVSVQYSFLDEWVNKPVRLGPDKDVFDKPEPIPLTIKGNFKIYVDFEKVSPFFSFREFTIKQTAYIMIESLKSGNSWAEYEETINFLKNFFTLAIMDSSYSLKIEGKIKKDKVRKKRILGRIVDEPVRYADIGIYITGTKFPELSESLSAEDMLFSYPQIKSNVNSLLRNWLVNSSLFKIIYNTYFGTIFKGDEMFIENQFLNVITTLEAYHRSITSNIEINEYLHKKRVDTIIDGAPEDYKTWISHKLTHSNEPNLRTRLYEIMLPYTEIFKDKRRIDSFIYKILNNRNSLVHPEKDRDIDYKQLFNILVILKIVFELYLLEHMGFETEMVKELINKKKEKKITAFKYMKMV
ncbi:HEPN domain-containing protein [Methanobacterium sp.]|uniref:ApeA N-terminal domain 1-containing protein n=1 Tax=Methanobacterium sp. TaxID=2164 RepID=UPI0025F26A69|nr:HEPN domain-containing protein [Methanobacterium sp.]MBI5458999.1 hypothetical protein [Methanobacterium sp.]